MRRTGHNFGKALHAVLSRQGIKVTELSRKTGIPAKTIYHWINGVAANDIYRIYDIAQVLKIPIETLIFGDAPIPSSAEQSYDSVVIKIEKGKLFVSAGSDLLNP